MSPSLWEIVANSTYRMFILFLPYSALSVFPFGVGGGGGGGSLCVSDYIRKGKRKVQGVPQSQAAAHPKHEEKEKDKTKQAQIE